MSAADQGREGPDGGDEADTGKDGAAEYRGAFQVRVVELFRRWLDDRQQIADEQGAAEGQREPREEIFSEEHASQDAVGGASFVAI